MDRKRADDIFERALELPAPDRVAFVRDRCAGDRELLDEVLSLLDALDRAEGFLAHPTVDRGPRAPEPEAPSLIGSSIGPFKLLEQIGEGGFGTVYLAEQSQPIRRRVAIKVLKPGMDSRQVIARFEAERQALAIMDHPNIARVFDAGTTAAGRPYFVMELVRGEPITTYCDRAQLSPRERLELLVPVSLAVQHAHAKGVVHRDLKPGNVLVTMLDGAPVPKVIDFGIAKALGGRLGDQTVYTEFRQMIGTPAYMSPEQAEMSGQDIDIRSDVYSLGVLMYELLSGSTPFDTTALARAGIAEIQRIIREEEPPKPSTRISTAGDRLVTIASCRRTEPKRLGNLVRGELDWIVMRALEKDRRRRYQTADAFAADVRRYLAGEAVQARPASASYKARKFVARNKALVTSIVAIASALLLGLVVSSIGFYRAAKARDRAVSAEAEQSKLRQLAELAKQDADTSASEARAAEKTEAAARERATKEAARAESMLRFSDLMIGSADPDVTSTSSTTTREMLDRAAERAGDYFKDQPESEFAVRVRIGRAYWAQRELANAIEQFVRADELARQLPNLDPIELFSFYSSYWSANGSLYDLAKTSPRLRLPLAMRAAIEPKYPEVWRTIESMKTTGLVWSQLDEARGHEIAAELEKQIREKIGLHAPERLPAIFSLVWLGDSAANRRNFGNDPDSYSRLAIDCFDRALTLLLEILPETNSDVAMVRSWRALAYRDLKDYPRALEAIREWKAAASKTLPADHWLNYSADGFFGAITLLSGDAAGAIAPLESGAAGLAKAGVLGQLANDFAERAGEAHTKLGNLERAAYWEKIAAEWVAAHRAVPQTDAVTRRLLKPGQEPFLYAVVRVRSTLASGSPDAGPAILEAIELRQKLIKPEDPVAYAVLGWETLIGTLFESGRQAPGVTRPIYFRLNQEISELSSQLPQVPALNRAHYAYRMGYSICNGDSPDIPPNERGARSEPLLREAARGFQAADPEHPYGYLIRSWLGQSLYLQGKYEEAVPLLREAMEPIIGESGAGSAYSYLVVRRLTLCLLALKQFDEARAIIAAHLARPGADASPDYGLRYFSEALLRGEGQTNEQLTIALSAARGAAAKNSESGQNRMQLVEALRRAGQLQESDGLRATLLEPGVLKGPSEINEVCWAVVRSPGAAQTEIAKAVQRSREATEAAPKNAALANTLAVALYRNHQFEEAAALATVRLTSTKATGFTTDPSAGDFAVLAMSLHQLGRLAEAQAALDSVPAALLVEPLDPDDKLLLDEARRLLGKGPSK